jgi:hypothetical protein
MFLLNRKRPLISDKFIALTLHTSYHAHHTRNKLRLIIHSLHNSCLSLVEIIYKQYAACGCLMMLTEL